jgi:hypothetical protein
MTWLTTEMEADDRGLHVMTYGCEVGTIDKRDGVMWVTTIMKADGRELRVMIVPLFLVCVVLQKQMN